LWLRPLRRAAARGTGPDVAAETEAMAAPILGLDVGTTKIAAVIGRPLEDGTLEILGVGRAPADGLRRGVVVDIDRTVASITQAVAACESVAGLRVHAAIVGITGGHISSLNSKAQIMVSHPDGLITQEDVERVEENARTINLPADYEIINAIPRHYIVDGQSGINNPVGMYGRKLEVESHVVIGMRTFARNLQRCVEMAGLSTEDTILEPVATARAVLTRDEIDLGVALFDIGGGTTDIALFTNGSICFTASVPLGGTHVTRDIAAGLRTSLAEAERLKIEAGSALAEAVEPQETIHYRMLGSDQDQTIPRRLLAEIIEARMLEILTLARRALAKSPFYKYVAGGVALSGGGSLIRDCARLTSQVLDGLGARVCTVSGISGLTNEVQSPIFATAVGLAMCGPRLAEPTPSAVLTYAKRAAAALRGLWAKLLRAED